MFKRFLLVLLGTSAIAMAEESTANMNEGYAYVGGGVEYKYPSVQFGYRKRYQSMGLDINTSAAATFWRHGLPPVIPNINGVLLWYPSETNNISAGLGTSALHILGGTAFRLNARRQGARVIPFMVYARFGNEWKSENGQRYYINFGFGPTYVGLQSGVGF